MTRRWKGAEGGGEGKKEVDKFLITAFSNYSIRLFRGSPPTSQKFELDLNYYIPVANTS